MFPQIGCNDYDMCVVAYTFLRRNIFLNRPEGQRVTIVEAKSLREEFLTLVSDAEW